MQLLNYWKIFAVLPMHAVLQVLGVGNIKGKDVLLNFRTSQQIKHSLENNTLQNKAHNIFYNTV